MGKGILADLLIKLGLDSKGFEQGIDKAKQKTNAFASSMKAIGSMIAGAFAVSSIIAFGKHIFQLANESIRVENELGAAIRANGKDVKSNLDAYKAFANEMQRVSTVDDETTLSLIRLAETMQSKAPMEAAKNAIALSKALGIDLQTATKMAVLAQSDMYTMLQRYVPALREAGTAAERTAAYNKLLASGQAMLSDELKTTEGKIIQNKNAWDNVKESWGTLISESKLLSWVLQKINDDLTISNSSLKWYEKWWYRITQQHSKGAKVANERSEAEAAAAAAGVKTQSEYGNLLSEITVNAEEYNKKLQKQKEAKEAAFKAWEKENDEIQKQIDLLNEFEIANNKAINSIKSKYDPMLGLGKDKAAPDSVMGMLKPEKEQDLGFNTEAYQKSLNDFAEFKQQFAYMVEDFGVNVIDQFGEAMGEFMATGNFPADFGKNILSIIGGFISQLGKMLIGLGIASEAFQALLKSAFVSPIGSAAAIAAGAGLVLLGGALKGAAQAGPKGSTSASGSGGYSVTSQSYSKTNNGSYQGSNKNGVIELQAVLKGDSIYLSNQRNSYKRSVVG